MYLQTASIKYVNYIFIFLLIRILLFIWMEIGIIMKSVKMHALKETQFKWIENF